MRVNKWVPAICGLLMVGAFVSDKTTVTSPVLILCGAGALFLLWATTRGGARWWAIGCLAAALVFSLTPVRIGTLGDVSPFLFGALVIAALAPSVYGLVKEATTAVASARRTVAELKSARTRP